MTDHDDAEAAEFAAEAGITPDDDGYQLLLKGLSWCKKERQQVLQLASFLGRADVEAKVSEDIKRIEDKIALVKREQTIARLEPSDLAEFINRELRVLGEIMAGIPDAEGKGE